MPTLNPPSTYDVLSRERSLLSQRPSISAEVVDVLVVDDEPALRALLSDVLIECGVSCRCADSGRAALRLLEQQTFSLVVTDIHMPDGDGLEVIMYCAASRPRVRVLAISGGGNFVEAEATLKPARLLGSRRTLAKPFSTMEFVRTVLEMLGRQ